MTDAADPAAAADGGGRYAFWDSKLTEPPRLLSGVVRPPEAVENGESRTCPFPTDHVHPFHRAVRRLVALPRVPAGRRGGGRPGAPLCRRILPLVVHDPANSDRPASRHYPVSPHGNCIHRTRGRGIRRLHRRLSPHLGGLAIHAHARVAPSLRGYPGAHSLALQRHHVP